MTDSLTHNRYTYVNGDPINHWDPTGHCTEKLSDEEYLQCVYVLQFDGKTDDLEGTADGDAYYYDQVGNTGDSDGFLGALLTVLRVSLFGETPWVVRGPR